MDTLQQIEKRRRELRFISLLLIYLLALTVVGLFLFVDQLVGLLGALQSSMAWRLLFMMLILVFIVYLTQKERMQAKLTQQLLAEVSGSAERLKNELRYNKFLEEVRGLVRNLDDDAALEKLFRVGLQFFKADGGAVILRSRGTSWKRPLVSTPANIDEALIEEMTKVIGRTGRSFIQPQPEYPDHRLIKSVNSMIAVPLRMENRLYGLIALWSNGDTLYTASDLDVLELVAKETSGAESGLRKTQGRADQIHGLLELISRAGDEKAKTLKRTALLVKQAGAVGAKLGLPKETIDAMETAARLRNIDLVANGAAGEADAAAILADLNFPQEIVDALTTERPLPIAAQVLALSEIYVAKAFPQRGRKPAPGNVLTKLKPLVSGVYDDRVFDALQEVAEAAEANKVPVTQP